MDEPNSPDSHEPAVGSVPDPPCAEPAPMADAVSEQPPSPQNAAVIAPEPANPVKKKNVPRLRGGRATRVAREPTLPEPEQCPAMLFAGLNSTLKLLVQQERRQKLASLPIV